MWPLSFSLFLVHSLLLPFNTLNPVIVRKTFSGALVFAVVSARFSFVASCGVIHSCHPDQSGHPFQLLLPPAFLSHFWRSVCFFGGSFVALDVASFVAAIISAFSGYPLYVYFSFVVRICFGPNCFALLQREEFSDALFCEPLFCREFVYLPWFVLIAVSQLGHYSSG